VSKEKVEEIQEEIKTKYFRYPAVKKFLPVSSKSGKNINKLQREILNLAVADPHFKQVFPSSFLQVMLYTISSIIYEEIEAYGNTDNKMEQLIYNEREMNTPPVLSFEEFKSIARCCGVGMYSKYSSLYQ